VRFRGNRRLSTPVVVQSFCLFLETFYALLVTGHRQVLRLVGILAHTTVEDSQG
jgi:hypothetical protein